MELDITNDEAIVLWNLLKRYSEDNVLGTNDQAEQRALWNLECLLEKEVGNLYDGSWDKALAQATERLRDEGGTDSNEEIKRGRLALWLEPKEIEFILSEWRKAPAESSPEVNEAWGKISFRCNSALHKAGLKK